MFYCKTGVNRFYGPIGFVSGLLKLIETLFKLHLMNRKRYPCLVSVERIISNISDNIREKLKNFRDTAATFAVVTSVFN